MIDIDDAFPPTPTWAELFHEKRSLEAELTYYKMLDRAKRPDVKDCMDPWTCCVHSPEEAEASD